jgi:uncharacterized protein
MTQSLSIDLADLGTEKLALAASLPPGEVDLHGEGVRQVGPMEWSGYIQRHGAGFRLQGRLAAELELQCVRCLESRRESVRKECELYFEPRETLLYAENDEIQLEESDTQTSFITGTELALSEIIREQVFLALPMKPLCSSECLGLCSVCGVNLNTHLCECSTQDFNPAFEGLLEFKKQLQRRSS